MECAAVRTVIYRSSIVFVTGWTVFLGSTVLPYLSVISYTFIFPLTGVTYSIDGNQLRQTIYNIKYITSHITVMAMITNYIFSL